MLYRDEPDIESGIGARYDLEGIEASQSALLLDSNFRKYRSIQDAREVRMDRGGRIWS